MDYLAIGEIVVNAALWTPGVGKVAARAIDWMKEGYNDIIQPMTDRRNGLRAQKINVKRISPEKGHEDEARFQFDNVQIIKDDDIKEEVEAIKKEISEEEKSEEKLLEELAQKNTSKEDTEKQLAEFRKNRPQRVQIDPQQYTVTLDVPKGSTFMGQIDFGDWEKLESKGFKVKIVEKGTNKEVGQAKRNQVLDTLKKVPLTLGQNSTSLNPDQKVGAATEEAWNTGWRIIDNPANYIATLRDKKLRSADVDPSGGQIKHLSDDPFIDGFANFVTQVPKEEGNTAVNRYFGTMERRIDNALILTQASKQRFEKKLADAKEAKKGFFKKMLLWGAAIVAVAVVAVAVIAVTTMVAPTLGGILIAAAGKAVYSIAKSPSNFLKFLGVIGIGLGLAKVNMERQTENIKIAEQQIKKAQEGEKALTELKDAIKTKGPEIENVLKEMQTLEDRPSNKKGESVELNFDNKDIGALGVSIICKSLEKTALQQCSHVLMLNADVPIPGDIPPDTIVMQRNQGGDLTVHWGRGKSSTFKGKDAEELSALIEKTGKDPKVQGVLFESADQGLIDLIKSKCSTDLQPNWKDIKLSLQNCSVTAVDVNKLANTLSEPSSNALQVREINLTGNNIGPRGVNIISEVLSKNFTLTKVQYDPTYVDGGETKPITAKTTQDNIDRQLLINGYLQGEKFTENRFFKSEPEIAAAAIKKVADNTDTTSLPLTIRKDLSKDVTNAIEQNKCFVKLNQSLATPKPDQELVARSFIDTFKIDPSRCLTFAVTNNITDKTRSAFMEKPLMLKELPLEQREQLLKSLYQKAPATLEGAELVASIIEKLPMDNEPLRAKTESILKTILKNGTLTREALEKERKSAKSNPALFDLLDRSLQTTEQANLASQFECLRSKNTEDFVKLQKNLDENYDIRGDFGFSSNMSGDVKKYVEGILIRNNLNHAINHDAVNKLATFMQICKGIPSEQIQDYIQKVSAINSGNAKAILEIVTNGTREGLSELEKLEKAQRTELLIAGLGKDTPNARGISTLVSELISLKPPVSDKYTSGIFGWPGTITTYKKLSFKEYASEMEQLRKTNPAVEGPLQAAIKADIESQLPCLREPFSRPDDQEMIRLKTAFSENVSLRSFEVSEIDPNAAAYIKNIIIRNQLRDILESPKPNAAKFFELYKGMDPAHLTAPAIDMDKLVALVQNDAYNATDKTMCVLLQSLDKKHRSALLEKCFANKTSFPNETDAANKAALVSNMITAVIADDSSFKFDNATYKENGTLEHYIYYSMAKNTYSYNDLKTKLDTQRKQLKKEGNDNEAEKFGWLLQTALQAELATKFPFLRSPFGKPNPQQLDDLKEELGELHDLRREFPEGVDEDVKDYVAHIINGNKLNDAVSDYTTPGKKLEKFLAIYEEIAPDTERQACLKEIAEDNIKILQDIIQTGINKPYDLKILDEKQRVEIFEASLVNNPHAHGIATFASKLLTMRPNDSIDQKLESNLLTKNWEFKECIKQLKTLGDKNPSINNIIQAGIKEDLVTRFGPCIKGTGSKEEIAGSLAALKDDLIKENYDLTTFDPRSPIGDTRTFIDSIIHRNLALQSAAKNDFTAFIKEYKDIGVSEGKLQPKELEEVLSSLNKEQKQSILKLVTSDLGSSKWAIGLNATNRDNYETTLKCDKLMGLDGPHRVALLTQCFTNDTVQNAKDKALLISTILEALKGANYKDPLVKDIAYEVYWAISPKNEGGTEPYSDFKNLKAKLEEIGAKKYDTALPGLKEALTNALHPKPEVKPALDLQKIEPEKHQASELEVIDTEQTIKKQI